MCPHVGEMAMRQKIQQQTWSSRIQLHNGDRMSQSEFHYAYENTPESYRAELIAGIVYEPSPLGYSHGRHETRLICLLDHYAGQTPGVEAASGATVILGDEDEVQPDVLLRITPECGGQSQNTLPATRSLKSKHESESPYYVLGAPELVAEISHSSRAIDLHIKKDRYAQAGVLEYLVVCLEPLKLYWFALQSKHEVTRDADGVSRSSVFPGLWIHANALLEFDYEASLRALNEGMQASDYKAFAAKLADLKR